MSTWDKFALITAIGADGRLTVGVRFVLMQVAWNWTAVDRATFHVRQATIAERLGVSLRLVKTAIADGRRHGYIVVETPRKRGTGHHGADLNRMTLPELSADSAYQSGELGAQSAPHSTELGARNDGVGCTDCQSEVHESTELGARANAPTCENDVPKGSLLALDKALERAPADAGTLAADVTVDEQTDEQTVWLEAELVEAEPPDPEPQRFCSAHMPDGTDDPCGACKTRRENHERWHERERLRLLQAVVLNRTPDIPDTRPSCPWCRDTGVVLNGDGRPGSSPRICHHDHTWHSMTDDELAEYADLIAELNKGVA